MCNFTCLNQDNTNGCFHVVYCLHLHMHVISRAFTTGTTIYTLLWLIDGCIVILYWHVLVATA